MELKFNKEESNKWYVDLPTYDGDHEDLEMVFGADILLDMLSEGSDSVAIDVSTEQTHIENYVYSTLIEHDDYGGTYRIDITYLPSTLCDLIELGQTFWLCNVAHFVFGEHPKEIYFNLIKNENERD